MSRGGTKASAPSRADKFAGTLHDAESRQLEQFVKSRNAELDKEIAAMKSRLGSSVLNMSVSGRGLTAMDAISGKFPNSSAVNMNVLREREHEEDIAAQLDNSHHQNQHTHNAGSGDSPSKGNARAHSDSHEPPIAVTNATRPGGANSQTGNIKSLLGRIKLKMEDNMMSPAELRDMLLPSDLCLPTDTTTSIAELSLVLQTDLVLPLTRDDQLSILKSYGSPDGSVDVKRMLSDAGVWHEGTTQHSRRPMGAEAAMSRIHHGSDHNTTLLRTDEDKRAAGMLPARESKTSGSSESKLSAEEKEQQATLDRMLRGNNATDSAAANRLTAQLAGSAAYGDAMRAVSDTIPTDVAHSKEKEAVTQSERERFEQRMQALPGLLPEASKAKMYYGDTLARSAENSDALEAMHLAIAYERRELDADAIEKRRQQQELAAEHAARNIKIPSGPFEHTAPGPVLDRTTGKGLEIVRESSQFKEIERESAAAAVSFNLSGAVPVGTSYAHTGAAAGAGRDTLQPPNLSAPTPVSHAPRNPNMTLKEAALMDENARLKQELGAFDGEFWEQLEDLKFRYNKLQDVVGEDTTTKTFRNGYGTQGAAVRPVTAHDTSSGRTMMSASGTRARDGSQFLPLDNVAWAKRNATTAMDRAALDTPLVRGKHATKVAPLPSSPTRDSSHEGANAMFDDSPGRKTGLGAEAETFRNPMAQRTALHDRGFPERFPEEVTSRNARSTRGMPPAGYSGRDGTRPIPTSNPPIGGTKSQQLPLLRHTAGGYPTGPLYGEKEGAEGSLASMCERKLLFELGNHPNPEVASQSLIHRIMDVANKFGNRGKYLTPVQLLQCISSVGLRMSAAEVTMFAAGFGSDGQGGIDCEEMIEALQALLYNFVGEHDRLDGKRTARAGELQQEDFLEQQLKELLTTVGEGILAHDKKAVLGAGKNVFDTLFDPFVRSDPPRSGVLPFSKWVDVMVDLGSMLLRDELQLLASYFEVGRTSTTSSPDADEVASHRERQVKSMLSGAAKADERFAAWLASSGSRLGLEDTDEPLVAYQPLVGKLAEVIDGLIDSGGGMIAGAGMSLGKGKNTGSKEVDALLDGLWMLREFELIESLICQLELMKPNDRRRCLMSLQYALAAADTHNDGTVDGFTLLSSLLGSGFRLQRLNRVRLLKAVEELGGKMDYSELCQVLLRSCADWTAEERGLVSKILKSMGITVLERRAWLGRLRVNLMSAAVEYNKKQSALKANTLAAYTGSNASGAGAGTDPGIPPSNFLHCLRECGIVLSVEEEATLLDCLDTERLAELGAIERKKKEKTMVTNATFGVWGVPMVYYKSFLAFCSRHTGDWSDAAPETTTAVLNMIRSTSEPMKGLHEFSSLLQAFDEGKSGTIGNRAFQIVCHRARLFANLNETEIRSLSDILTAEGGGKIRYTSFLIHLRVLCGRVLNEANAEIPDIAEQLLTNCTDAKNTLLPLRNWLLRHTDIASCKLSMKELSALLREFSVLYRPDDLQSLLLEVGGAGPQAQQGDGLDQANAGMTGGGGGGESIDTRDLFRHLFKIRGPWMQKQPYICNRMVNSMSMTGAVLFTTAPGEAPNSQEKNSGGSTFGFPKGPRGVETAAARRILARLRAFTEISSFNGAAAGSSGASAGGGEGRMVDLDVFGAIAKATGLPLSDEELLILADATDFHPLANRIRCDVVLEAISFENSSTGGVGGNHASDAGDKKKTKKSLIDQEMSDAATFAIKHLRDQIWNTCKRLKRSADEWINDVNAVFRGFDNGGVGFITTDDFTMALALLNAPCSADILRDIPSVPEGPGMVSYREILDALLVPPASMFAAGANKTKGMGPAHTASSKTGAGEHKNDSSAAGGEKSTSAGSSSNKKAGSQEEKDKKERELAVNMLVTVVRKSCRNFIVNDHSLEEAWMCLVRAFKRFDTDESGKCPPRDFCLAVSVLLEGDEVLLTESQWTDIIQHFTVSEKDKKKGDSAAVGAPANSQQLVNYMEFCQAVLEPKACKELQTNAKMLGARAVKRK